MHGGYRLSAPPESRVTTVARRWCVLRMARENAAAARKQVAAKLELWSLARLRVGERGFEPPRPHLIPRLATALAIEPCAMRGHVRARPR
jgi:hypothetical protein